MKQRQKVLDEMPVPETLQPDQAKGRSASRLREWMLLVPARHVFVLMGFLGLVNVYTLRVSLSVAIVAMVRHTEPPPITAAGNWSSASEVHQTQCLPRNPRLTEHTNVTSVDMGHGAATFDWDASVQGLVLGSFFYGYILTVIPGGVLAEQFGPKWLIGGGILITSLLSLLIPLAANLHHLAVVAIRVLQGLAEGVTFPAMHCMISLWTPITSRSRVIAITQSGSDVGAVVAMIGSGLLADSGFLGGWPSIFYVFGLFGMLWFLAWCFLVYDTPQDHPRISGEELNYILANQGSEQAELKRKVPWRKVLLSAAVWSGLLSHFGFNWIHYIFLTEMPTYLTSVLRYDLGSNGLLSAIPYILGAVFSCLASMVADWLRKRHCMSVTSNRKLFNCLGVMVPGLFLLLVPTAGCNGFWNMVLLSTAGAFHGMGHSGFMAAYVDMAPDFAGTLLGISNIGGSIPGFAIPSLLGWLLKDEDSLAQWAIFFYIGSVIAILTALEFVLFGSADLQSWGLGLVSVSVVKYGASSSSSSSRVSSPLTDPPRAPPERTDLEVGLQL